MHEIKERAPAPMHSAMFVCIQKNDHQYHCSNTVMMSLSPNANIGYRRNNRQNGVQHHNARNKERASAPMHSAMSVCSQKNSHQYHCSDTVMMPLSPNANIEYRRNNRQNGVQHHNARNKERTLAPMHLAMSVICSQKTVTSITV